jgi:proteasome lid subunit RPN8/RPN11
VEHDFFHNPSPLAAEDDDFRILSSEVFQPQAVALGLPLGHFSVFISRAAITNLLRHGEKGLQTDQEVAGGLVGQPGYDPETGQPFTRIRAALPANGQASATEVEIPPEEWARLLSVVLDEGPDQGPSFLVGWYHSHPTFDAYLSPLDQETQLQFFAEDWQVAIVVGPLRRQIKAFHGGQSRACPLYLDPDETGNTLVPVTYEVSAGGVSTPLGIEWVDPAPGPGAYLEMPDMLSGDPPTLAPIILTPYPEDPAGTASAAYDPGLAPAPALSPLEQEGWPIQAAAPPAPAWTNWINRLDLSPTLVGLLILAVLFGMVLMLGLALLFRFIMP